MAEGGRACLNSAEFCFVGNRLEMDGSQAQAINGGSSFCHCRSFGSKSGDHRSPHRFWWKARDVLRRVAGIPSFFLWMGAILKRCLLILRKLASRPFLDSEGWRPSASPCLREKRPNYANRHCSELYIIYLEADSPVDGGRIRVHRRQSRRWAE